MQIDLKPVGAFLENTVRPMIEEGRWFLAELERQGIKISEENIVRVLREFLLHSLLVVIARSVLIILVSVIIAFTSYLLLK